MRLIVNADDLGYSPAVNEAVWLLHDRGRLDSASLLVNLPHSGAAMMGAADRPGLAVGIHLNLTKGRPCLAPEQVPSLVGSGGAFFSSPAFFPRALAGRVRLVEVEAELQTQIERALAAGIALAHLDSHSHWHALPRFGRLVQALAAEHAVPRLRQANPFRALLPNPLWLAAVPTAMAPPMRGGPTGSDYMLSLHHWLRNAGEAVPLLFGRRVRRLLDRPGVTVELVLHPGRAADPDFPPDTLPAERREWELEFVQSAAFDDWLAAVGAERDTGGGGMQ